jgi:hypothetical protein
MDDDGDAMEKAASSVESKAWRSIGDERGSAGSS